ncbi:MAG: type II toxin-antitoxin system VapC family toxin [Candidatus Binatia bacterium]
MAVFDFAAPLPDHLYWDSSFLVNVAFAAAKFHDPCAAYYYRLKEEGVPVVLSNLALDETWYILMKLETEQLYHPQGFWEIYREEPERLRPILRALRDFTKRLLQLPHVTLVGTQANAYETALETMDRSLLLPRDAYHWALMQDGGLTAIATTDADFTRIPKATLYTCNERILSQ